MSPVPLSLIYWTGIEPLYPMTRSSQVEEMIDVAVVSNANHIPPTEDCL